MHIFVLIIFGNAIYLQKEHKSPPSRFTAKLDTKTKSLAPATIKKPKRTELLRNSIVTPPAAPEETSNFSPNLDFPYSAREFDTQPEPLGDVNLSDIFEREDSETGKIELLLLVSKNGIVVWGIAEHSDYSTLVTGNVASLFKKVIYKPATKDGLPVNALIRIEVNHAREQD